eukprot:CAMPEP_0178769034 /NCGR_PEP_ID=MMETSP0744-20121128/20595_1 /TAXON_ID=913974 /ORGANISM="Nitzschia punctata, Strain CCMP561" /LENGTH=116 /DNA_ID=CAMNT_0020425221 /DNA_START=469 /DNA_END=819 /DNA_ORIENTATION=-
MSIAKGLFQKFIRGELYGDVAQSYQVGRHASPKDGNSLRGQQLSSSLDHSSRMDPLVVYDLMQGLRLKARPYNKERIANYVGDGSRKDSAAHVNKTWMLPYEQDLDADAHSWDSVV